MLRMPEYHFLEIAKHLSVVRHGSAYFDPMRNWHAIYRNALRTTALSVLSTSNPPHMSTRRWLRTTDQTTLTAFAIIAAFTVIHLVLAAVIGFGVDESYTLSIARDLSLSYFDHPPLHIWIAHFAQNLIGTGHAVRLPFVALSAVSSWLIYALTKALFGPRAGIWSLLAFNLSAFFAVAAGGWVLPDGPLNTCLLAAALTATHLLDQRPDQRQWRVWIAIGFWVGLGALAKYHAIVFGIGLLGFLATARKQRHHFGELAPYAALAIAAVLFVPVLIWNAQNGFASFLFQGNRGLPQNTPDASRLILQVVGEILLLLPWIFVPLAIATVQAVPLARTDERYRLCLWLGLPNVVLFTLSPVCGLKGMPHWPMPGWLLLFPLLGASLAEINAAKIWPRLWLGGSIILAMALGLLAATDSTTGWVGASLPSLFVRGDPTIESLEWTPLRTRLAQAGLLSRRHLFVVALDWKDAGKIDQALGGALPVHVFGPRQHGYAFQSNPGGILADDALLIGKRAAIRDRLAALRTYFRSTDPISNISLGRDGESEVTLSVHYAHDLLKPYSQRN